MTGPINAINFTGTPLIANKPAELSLETVIGDCSCNNLSSDIIQSMIKGASNFGILTLRGLCNNCTESCLKKFPNISQLTFRNYLFENISEDTLRLISDLTRLKKFEIYHSVYVNEMLQRLFKFRASFNWEVLNLFSCDLSDETLAILQPKLLQLEVLEIPFNRDVSVEGLQVFKKSSICHLDLTGDLRKLTIEEIDSCLKVFQSLEERDLIRIILDKDSLLHQEMSEDPNLKHLLITQSCVEPEEQAAGEPTFEERSINESNSYPLKESSKKQLEFITISSSDSEATQPNDLEVSRQEKGMGDYHVIRISTPSRSFLAVAEKGFLPPQFCGIRETPLKSFNLQLDYIDREAIEKEQLFQEMKKGLLVWERKKEAKKSTEPALGAVIRKLAQPLMDDIVLEKAALEGARQTKITWSNRTIGMWPSSEQMELFFKIQEVWEYNRVYLEFLLLKGFNTEPQMGKKIFTDQLDVLESDSAAIDPKEEQTRCRELVSDVRRKLKTSKTLWQIRREINALYLTFLAHWQRAWPAQKEVNNKKLLHASIKKLDESWAKQEGLGSHKTTKILKNIEKNLEALRSAANKNPGLAEQHLYFCYRNTGEGELAVQTKQAKFRSRYVPFPI